jgi:hypothetical protein
MTQSKKAYNSHFTDEKTESETSRKSGKKLTKWQNSGLSMPITWGASYYTTVFFLSFQEALNFPPFLKSTT